MTVHGTTGHLAVPIFGIPLLALGAGSYYREHLPEFCVENAEKVIAMVALFSLVLAGIAAFRKARSVRLAGASLRYRSWLGEHRLQLSEITHISLETEVFGTDDRVDTDDYLTLWSGRQRRLRFNTALWPQRELGALLRSAQRQQPSIRLDRAVETWLALA